MFNNITLEVSLKPFYDTNPVSIRKVCKDIFAQWQPLLKHRKEVSIMLWTADGSEILDYSGKLSDEFEWCKYLGTANMPLLEEGADPGRSLHERKQLYRKDPPVMTYGILKTIVSSLREAGAAACPGARLLIGETLDIGPEFAVSSFKYERHTEVSTGSNLAGKRCIDVSVNLKGDVRTYAAYPDGIPEGTPFGSFIGKQSQAFLTDMGFDYLWLSNGVGFSSNPWDFSGKVFDGEHFHPDKLKRTRKKVLEFWHLFRAECPDFPIYTRGTNNSAGIDYATDGVPLYELYRAGLNFMPPPNSPWAAINDDYGLEIMGHMSRMCDLPGDDFPFRYYIHDPWWVNTPWYDRYNGSPSDIYLPMAVSRIDENGVVRSANRLNILSIDNSFGGMPDSCVYEPLPHLLKAEKDIADAPAPLVWLYPVKEFTTSCDEALLSEMYYGDRYICDAINNGFPLNCVVSTENFLKHDLGLYSGSIIVTPYQPDKAVVDKLYAFKETGGQILAYGSCEKLKQLELPVKLDIKKTSTQLISALESFSYGVRFEHVPEGGKPAALAVSRRDNALLISAYNPHRTTDILLTTPLGAPVPLGMEAAIEGSWARCRFSRAEHLECRVFVKQAGGVVSAVEMAPVNKRYRRSIKISGLKDAEVCVFFEAYCADKGLTADRIGDRTPIPQEGWSLVRDSRLGTYFTKSHVSGDVMLLMPGREYV